MSHIDDMMFQAAQAGVVQVLDDDANEPEHVILVAPLGTEVPDDGILTYVTIDVFYDLLNVAHGSVVLFREDQAKLLEVFARERSVFARSVKALYGVPGATYEPWFDDATFGLPKLSYSPLVSEIRIANDVAAVKEANRPLSVVEREEKQYKRADGSVRYDHDISVAKEGEDDDNDD